MCKTLWDNSKSQLLPPYDVYVSVCGRFEEETYLLTLHTMPGFIHLVIMQQPAGHRCTEPVTRITWTVNIISISSCPCDAQHLTGFRWCGGRVGGRLARLRVCVSVCFRVGVCRFVSSGACRMWTCGVTVGSGGWITACCAVVKCCCICQHTAVPVQEHWLR